MYNESDYAGETLERNYEEAFEARNEGFEATGGGGDYAIECKTPNVVFMSVQDWLRDQRVAFAAAAAHSDRRAA